jgi:hypothetical protein
MLSGAPENALAESESTLLSSREPGSIWNYLGVQVRSAGVPGRFACDFRTDLHFADAAGYGTTQDRYNRNPGFAALTSDFL